MSHLLRHPSWPHPILPHLPGVAWAIIRPSQPVFLPVLLFLVLCLICLVFVVLVAALCLGRYQCTDSYTALWYTVVIVHCAPRVISLSRASRVLLCTPSACANRPAYLPLPTRTIHPCVPLCLSPFASYIDAFLILPASLRRQNLQPSNPILQCCATRVVPVPPHTPPDKSVPGIFSASPCCLLACWPACLRVRLAHRTRPKPMTTPLGLGLHLPGIAAA